MKEDRKLDETRPNLIIQAWRIASDDDRRAAVEALEFEWARERGAPGEFDWLENADEDFIASLANGDITLEEIESYRKNNPTKAAKSE